MIRDTRYIFFGTPRFAAIILEKLIDAGMPPVALVCNPDRPVGRKQVITPPPTKEVVIRDKRQGIKIFQPKTKEELVTISDQLFQDADFGIVAAYAMIIPKEVIEKSKLGIIGVHPSLLPKFRGPSPIQSAILAGEKETGVSLFLMDEKLDHGPIIAERKITINNLFAYSRELENRLAEVSAELLIETLPNLMEGKTTPLSQDEFHATYTKKFASEDAFISEEDLVAATSGRSPKEATEIDRKIRALNPEPGVWTLQRDKRVKLLEAVIGSNKLVLKKIQEEGKKPKTH